MDYQKKYQEFYTKYYDKAELLIKKFLIKKQRENWTYTYSSNEAGQYLYNYTINRLLVNNNENLKKLLYYFNNRYEFYAINQIQEVFTLKLKPDFERIKNYELPEDYSLNRLILEIAILEAFNEISRLLSNNSRLYEMMYKLNEFDLFEIRFYKDLNLEDYPDFQRLRLKLYPNYDDNNNLGLKGTQIIIEADFENSDNTPQLYSLFINSKVLDCFLEYQKYIIDFYIDFSYLKKRLENEKLIHYHKDNEFMKIIFEDMRLISQKNYDKYNEEGKLKSLGKSTSAYRENNFNIIFSELL